MQSGQTFTQFLESKKFSVTPRVALTDTHKRLHTWWFQSAKQHALAKLLEQHDKSAQNTFLQPPQITQNSSEAIQKCFRKASTYNSAVDVQAVRARRNVRSLPDILVLDRDTSTQEKHQQNMQTGRSVHAQVTSLENTLRGSQSLHYRQLTVSSMSINSGSKVYDKSSKNASPNISRTGRSQATLLQPNQAAKDLREILPGQKSQSLRQTRSRGTQGTGLQEIKELFARDKNFIKYADARGLNASRYLHNAVQKGDISQSALQTPVITNLRYHRLKPDNSYALSQDSEEYELNDIFEPVKVSKKKMKNAKSRETQNDEEKGKILRLKKRNPYQLQAILNENSLYAKQGSSQPISMYLQYLKASNQRQQGNQIKIEPEASDALSNALNTKKFNIVEQLETLIQKNLLEQISKDDNFMRELRVTYRISAKRLASYFLKFCQYCLNWRSNIQRDEFLAAKVPTLVLERLFTQLELLLHTEGFESEQSRQAMHKLRNSSQLIAEGTVTQELGGARETLRIFQDILQQLSVIYPQSILYRSEWFNILFTRNMNSLLNDEEHLFDYRKMMHGHANPVLTLTYFDFFVQKSAAWESLKKFGVNKKTALRFLAKLERQRHYLAVSEQLRELLLDGALRDRMTEELHWLLRQSSIISVKGIEGLKPELKNLCSYLFDEYVYRQKAAIQPEDVFLRQNLPALSGGSGGAEVLNELFNCLERVLVRACFPEFFLQDLRLKCMKLRWRLHFQESLDVRLNANCTMTQLVYRIADIMDQEPQCQEFLLKYPEELVNMSIQNDTHSGLHMFEFVLQLLVSAHDCYSSSDMSAGVQSYHVSKMLLPHYLRALRSALQSYQFKQPLINELCNLVFNEFFKLQLTQEEREYFKEFVWN